MAAYKAPNFTERAAAAKQAKQDALEKLRARPEPDPAVVAARQAAQAAREAEQTAKRQAKRDAAAAAIEAARIEAERIAEAARVAEAERIAEAERLALAKRAMTRPELTAEERKAARDARYAARKQRAR